MYSSPSCCLNVGTDDLLGTAFVLESLCVFVPGLSDCSFIWERSLADRCEIG